MTYYKWDINSGPPLGKRNIFLAQGKIMEVEIDTHRWGFLLKIKRWTHSMGAHEVEYVSFVNSFSDMHVKFLYYFIY